MRDYVNTSSDNGGVHINSGIPNHAFYLAAKEIGGNAWEKTGNIWYVTLRDRLHENSDFQEAASMTVDVAGQLYGVGSMEQRAVGNAWEKVGVKVITRNL
jgi:Zn-dependent metalloprotease